LKLKRTKGLDYEPERAGAGGEKTGSGEKHSCWKKKKSQAMLAKTREGRFAAGWKIFKKGGGKGRVSW